jgi:hypothetical protein
MNSIDDILNSGATRMLEEIQDLMTVLGSRLLSDERGIAPASYVALMTLWRKIEPGGARLMDTECSRCADGRYRLHPDSELYPDQPDYRVDVTSP